jgi:hypothetical protein
MALLSPVLLGNAVMLVLAVLSNNVTPTRHFPDRWN